MNTKERRDYIEAAIMNDREMYQVVECDAYFWSKLGDYGKCQAAADFVTLYAEKVNEMFPWAHFMNDEIMSVYVDVVTSFENPQLPVPELY